MKSSTVTVTLATLFAASAKAAKLTRRRTQTQHKSLDERYLGLAQNDRALAGHGDHDKSMPLKEVTHMEEGSMSMSMSMSLATEEIPLTGEGTASTGSADESAPIDAAVEDDETSGAMSVGTTISTLAAAGAMMLL
eukprot:CAMPEP_0196231198 /NCGR_PEP_ID=MMETSP0913-20130531/2101_1 /TAXON_ID=49265 /ORGANISM="Thalassiosira rotula, Strain GSO102" /LENGTH=135 /DNA_ID=CAMNT_0041511345 /DNA_START=53 /DNA_END=460 /DNA_ORIENTATION=+